MQLGVAPGAEPEVRRLPKFCGCEAPETALCRCRRELRPPTLLRRLLKRSGADAGEWGAKGEEEEGQKWQSQGEGQGSGAPAER
eukprot:scaffold923_cov256-Pinguiococcus_pyrenoidosus.AAC.42